MSPSSTLVFTVRRKQPELVRPAKPTPQEIKLLSDIDDQEGLRFFIPIIQFYKNDPSSTEDPAKVIRDAIAKALVFYYPFAGRLREGPDRKLMVDCTGEGVLFIEAEADVTLEQFGDELYPPFPLLKELQHDVPGYGEILGCPLLHIQVTRLACGGFIFALRLNHAMSDAPGLVQFMNAVGEIARGAVVPSVSPVWQRELLNARNPPRVTCTHHEYDAVPDSKGTTVPLDSMVQECFFFGPKEVVALRKLVPSSLRSRTSTIQVLLACSWRCQTIALQPDPSEEVRMLCIVTARTRLTPPIPVGYYGNAFAFSTALTTAGELCRNPLGYALELVAKTKTDMTEEYMHSAADFLVSKGRPHFTVVRSYVVSDLTRARFEYVDFGWGNPIYGGLATVGVDSLPGVLSFYSPFEKKSGEKGILVPVCLPASAMERFKWELQLLLSKDDQLDNVAKDNVFPRSTM